VSDAVPPTKLARRERMAWAIAGVATLGLAAALAGVVVLRRPAPPPAAIRFQIPLPARMSSYFDVQATGLSVSPDGRQLIFVGVADGQRQLWLRPLDQVVARAIPGTEDAYSPFWSPDGRYVAFFAGGKLKRIEPAGTSLQTICDLPGGIVSTTGAWGQDGVILFNVLNETEQTLFRVTAAGGTATLFVKGDFPWWPHFLPDGRHYLVYRFNQDPSKQGIVVASLDSTDTKLVVPTKFTRVEYGNGYLVYAREGSLVAQRFDERSLQISGDPITVVERVPFFENTGWAGYSISRNGVLVHLTNFQSERLVWRDRSGREAGSIGKPGAWNMRIAPDGRRVAIVQIDPARLSGNVWIHELARGTDTLFALGPADNGNPVWAPDGKRIAFFSCCVPLSSVQSTLRIKDVGDPGPGASPLEPGFHGPTDWSLDGRFILFERAESSNKPTDIWVLSVEDRKAKPFLQTPFRESDARFSPDGRWVAYTSNETNRDEIYVARFDRPNEKSRVSIDGGRGPRWRRDGKELFFLSADNHAMAAATRTGDSFEFDRPVALFQSDSPFYVDWDAAPDGQRFLVGSAAATPFAVVVNWPSELKP